MKKVYILYPPISKQERYSSAVGSVGGNQIPLGIYYLASFLSDNNYSVEVCDAEAKNYTLDSIIEQIRKYNPDYIGISSTTVAFHRAIESAEKIKKSFPEKPIIIGGPHVTSNYLHAMSFEAFTYGVIGEGETTFLELLNTLNKSKDIDNIDGIVYRNKLNKIIKNKKRAFIENLDNLPYPSFDLIDDLSLYAPPPSNYRTLPVINIITSRGCPSQCTFCDRNIFGKKYRERSAENVFGEIEFLYKKFKIREIAFVDDTFFINQKRIYKLFDLIRNRGLYFHWTCMARINNVSYDFLKYIKENGCWSIAFGIESGDEKILEIIKKRISLEKIKQVITWCHELKIETKGFFIIGHPLETLETMNKTIEFACSLKLNSVVVTINTPIPGSPQYIEADKYGKLDITDWSKFNYWRPVFVPNGLTEEILLKKQKDFYLKFYLRPKIILSFVAGMFGKGGLKRFKSIISLFGYIAPQKQKRK